MNYLMNGIKVFISGLLLMACAEEETPSLYDPDWQSAPQPVIQEMEPAESSYAGVGNIHIYGQHFSSRQPYNAYNLVFFDNVRAQVLEASESEILIKSPNYIQDSIKVKVAANGSELFSEPVLYELKAAVDTTFGGVAELKPIHVAYSIAADPEGNIYVQCKRLLDPAEGTMLKITPEGVTETFMENTLYQQSNGMKYGPDNRLYVAFNYGRLKQIQIINEDGSTTTFASFGKIPWDLDFDPYQNVWATVQDELVRIKPDGTAETLDTYPMDLYTIRVYEDDSGVYVYTVGRDEDAGQQKVWRQKINADGLVDAREEILDATAADWIDSDINAVTFSATGDMYLASNSSPDALFIFNPESGTHRIQYPGLIKPQLKNLVWHGNNIFAVRQTPDAKQSQVLKIDVGIPGAPYYGRE